MNETELTQRLDDRGLLNASHRPGVYALECETPADDSHAVIERWADVFDAPMPDDALARFTAADRLVYVGSHGRSVYDRLAQHVRGHQSSTIMAAWPPVDVVDLWHEDHPRAHEWGYAVDLAVGDTAVWCDGDVL